MSMPKLSLAGALFFACFPVSVAGGETGFSEPATAEDIERVYWSIYPDGDNLPEGSGTVAQVASILLARSTASFMSHSM